MVREPIAMADAVKVNHEEAGVFPDGAGGGGGHTCGERGCEVRIGNDRAESPGYPVRVADTVGAGDAFAAAFLHGVGAAGARGRRAILRIDWARWWLHARERYRSEWKKSTIPLSYPYYLPCLRANGNSRKARAWDGGRRWDGDRGTDEFDVGGGGDFSPADRPITGIDQHAAEGRVAEIHDVSHGGGEDAGGLAGIAGVGFGPGDGHEFLAGSGVGAGSMPARTWPMTSGWLSPQRRGDLVDIGLAPKIVDAAKDRVPSMPGARMPRVLCFWWAP